MSKKYKIRLACFDELPLLNEIEEAASTIFKDTKYALEIDQKPIALNILQKQQQLNQVWVAVNDQDKLVGFAVALIIDNFGHLHELSVDPNYGKQGIGTNLVNQIINWAKHKHLKGVTLSTFINIPWNAPFYHKLGFTEMKEKDIGEGLKKIRIKEFEAGLPIEERIFMIYLFTDSLASF